MLQNPPHVHAVKGCHSLPPFGSLLTPTSQKRFSVRRKDLVLQARPWAHTPVRHIEGPSTATNSIAFSNLPTPLPLCRMLIAGVSMRHHRDRLLDIGATRLASRGREAPSGILPPKN